MKILITESRIYNAFKRFIEMEIEDGNLEVITSKKGIIYFIDKDVNCYMSIYPNNTSMIKKEMYDMVKDYFSIDHLELLKLFERYLSEKFNLDNVDAFFMNIKGK